jgi:long-chain acyl-CoA synthetase
MSSQPVILKEHPGIAILSGKRNVSYTELLYRTHLFSTKCPAASGAKTIIFSENREGWIYALLGIWSNRGIAVPVDVTSTIPEIVYILKDCQPACIWTSIKKADAIRQALSEAGTETPVMLIDDYEMTEITETEKSYVPYNDDDTSLIIYTSGTTGAAKGVMLSFRNIIANVNSVSKDVHIFSPRLRTMVLLPLHHVLPLMGSVIAPLMVGGGIAIAPSMMPVDIMETLQKGKIGIIIGVPRLWQTLYNGIKQKIDASPVTRFLFWLCKKLQCMTLSRFVFQSVRKKMGGRLTYCVSGGAALDREIGIGLRTLGLSVLEGYGMSETAPMISFTRPDDIIPGCVGKPMPSVTVDIRDGEIYVKGPNVMQGYYNNPEETANVIGKDGFLRTGDLGYFDKKGRLYITGRSKEIIVLSNGKNINPAEIEYKLDKYTQYVKESAVLQDGDTLRAIIVPQQNICEQSDEEIENLLKQHILQPYNETVAPYKRIMNLSVYRGELPRTRLDKLQRFKLPLLLNKTNTTKTAATFVEPTFPEYQIIKNYISKEKNVSVRPTDHLETDLALDSLDKISFQAFIESTFGLEMDQKRLLAFNNVTELAEYVADFKSFIEQEDIDWNAIINHNSNGVKLPATWATGVVITKIFKLLSKAYFHLKATGLENIPKDTPVIFASNHQSYFDGMFVMAYLNKAVIRKTYFYAKDEHVKNWFVKFLASKHNVIVMNSSNIKISIMKLSKVLKQGKNIIIFPEGTRTYDGNLNEFKKTFAILSKELNIPIVPIHISGAYEAFSRKTKIPHRKPVTIEYLPAYIPREEESYDEIARNIQQTIAQRKTESKQN